MCICQANKTCKISDAWQAGHLDFFFFIKVARIQVILKALAMLQSQTSLHFPNLEVIVLLNTKSFPEGGKVKFKSGNTWF